MSKPEPSDLQSHLEAIFNAERVTRDLTHKLQRAPKACDVIEQAVRAARGKDDDERGLQLACLTRILRGMKEPKAIDLLIDVLGDDSDEGRANAGVALEDLGLERLADLLAGIGRAIKHLPADHHALRELPFVILSVSEGDARRALLPFLGLSDAEAVASAVEALVENADPAAIENLAALKGDKRTVELEDDSTGETQELTIAELVADAIDALEEAKRVLSRAGD
jgi:hypothetical protein